MLQTQSREDKLTLRSGGTKVVSIIIAVSEMMAKNSKSHNLQIHFCTDILTLSALVSPIFLLSLIFSISS